MHHIVDIGDLCLLRRPCTDRNYSYGGGVRRIPYIPNRNYSQQRKADRLIWLRNLDILGYHLLQCCIHRRYGYDVIWLHMMNTRGHH